MRLSLLLLLLLLLLLVRNGHSSPHPSHHP